MSAVIRILGSMALVMSLAACQGKTKAEKAEDRVAEQNRLAGELNSMGAPSASWSEAEINAYEAKLNRLESLESQLRGMDGQDGISIYGANNSSFISSARRNIERARLARKQMTATESATDKFNRLVEDSKVDLGIVVKPGIPNKGQSERELSDYIEACDRLISNLNARLTLIVESPSSFQDRYELARKLGTAKTQIELLKSDAKTFLNEKIGDSSASESYWTAIVELCKEYSGASREQNCNSTNGAEKILVEVKRSYDLSSSTVRSALVNDAVKVCLDFSTATHPPCNTSNPVSAILGEIARVSEFYPIPGNQ